MPVKGAAGFITAALDCVAKQATGTQFQGRKEDAHGCKAARDAVHGRLGEEFPAHSVLFTCPREIFTSFTLAKTET